MRRESVFLMVFLIILVASSPATLGVLRVEASGTIYIRADGSIDPPTAPISTFDNATYTLTGNITSDVDGIVVERNNIVVEGSDFTVEGTTAYSSVGIYLNGRSNVTVQNTNIKNFSYGILLHTSSNNRIDGNNMTNNYWRGGIVLESSSYNNSINGNTITHNGEGIWLNSSSSNSISGNTITRARKVIAELTL
jgi:parallel beta-helix repeat protein